MAGVARACTLDEQDAAGALAVGRPNHRSDGRHALQLHVGDDIRANAVAEMRQARRIVGLPTRGQHDGARLERLPHAVDLYGDFESAGLALDAQDSGGAQHADIGMIRDGLHIGVRAIALRNRVGRRGRGLFAEQRGKSAEFPLPFHEDHAIAGRGGLQRGSHAGGAASHYQHRARDRIRQGGDRLGLAGPRDTHPQVVFGESLGVFVPRCVAPGHMLPQVDALRRGSVVEVESFGLEARRAGRDYHLAGHACFQVAADPGTGFGAAQGGIGPAQLRLALPGGYLFERGGIHSLADAAARTQIDGQLTRHGKPSIRRTAGPSRRRRWHSGQWKIHPRGGARIRRRKSRRLRPPAAGTRIHRA